MIVVDTQVLVYLLLPVSTPGDHERARAVLSKDPQWAVPPICRSEFLNVCAGYIRRRALTVRSAGEAVARAELVAATHTVRSESVLRLVPDSHCSAYDLEFVALARSLDVPLVTNDRQIQAAFPEVAISPEAFAT